MLESQRIWDAHYISVAEIARRLRQAETAASKDDASLDMPRPSIGYIIPVEIDAGEKLVIVEAKTGFGFTGSRTLIAQLALKVDQRAYSISSPILLRTA